jgi:hypothetical protein
MAARLAHLDVFCSDVTPNRAIVHARLYGDEALPGESLAGIVRGPRCSRGSTLPASYQLLEQQSHASGPVDDLPHATALITEPVFWSPDWPALYDVTIELRRDGAVIETATRTIGVRPLAVAGRHLVYGGKTWVLRAIRCDAPAEAILQPCREHAAALLAPAASLDEKLLTQASEEGVLVIAEISAGSAEAELARLSRNAAVAIGVLPPGWGAIESAAPGNILLAHHLVQGQSEPPPDDARLVMGEVKDSAGFAAWVQSLNRPAIAFRPLVKWSDVAAARAECDRLQRDLAAYGQFAGYIV